MPVALFVELATDRHRGIVPMTATDKAFTAAGGSFVPRLCFARRWLRRQSRTRNARAHNRLRLLPTVTPLCPLPLQHERRDNPSEPPGFIAARQYFCAYNDKKLVILAVAVKITVHLFVWHGRWS